MPAGLTVELMDVKMACSKAATMAGLSVELMVGFWAASSAAMWVADLGETLVELMVGLWAASPAAMMVERWAYDLGIRSGMEECVTNPSQQHRRRLI